MSPSKSHSWESAILVTIAIVGSMSATGCSSARRPVIHTSEDRDSSGALRMRYSFYWTGPGAHQMVYHGVRTTYFPGDTQPQEVQTFAEGIRHGVSSEWAADGRLIKETAFEWGGRVDIAPATSLLGVDQPPIDKRLFNWSAGSLTTEWFFDRDGETVGVIYRTLEGTNRARCIKAAKDAHGKYHDAHWVYWDADGQVIGTGMFRDGQPWDGMCFVEKQEGSLVLPQYGRYCNGQLMEPVKRPFLQIFRENPRREN